MDCNQELRLHKYYEEKDVILTSFMKQADQKFYVGSSRYLLHTIHEVCEPSKIYKYYIMNVNNLKSNVLVNM